MMRIRALSSAPVRARAQALARPHFRCLTPQQAQQSSSVLFSMHARSIASYGGIGSTGSSPSTRAQWNQGQQNQLSDADAAALTGPDLEEHETRPRAPPRIGESVSVGNVAVYDDDAEDADYAPADAARWREAMMAAHDQHQQDTGDSNRSYPRTSAFAYPPRTQEHHPLSASDVDIERYSYVPRSDPYAQGREQERLRDINRGSEGWSGDAEEDLVNSRSMHPQWQLTDDGETEAVSSNDNSGSSSGRESGVRSGHPQWRLSDDAQTDADAEEEEPLPLPEDRSYKPVDSREIWYTHGTAAAGSISVSPEERRREVRRVQETALYPGEAADAIAFLHSIPHAKGSSSLSSSQQPSQSRSVSNESPLYRFWAAVRNLGRKGFSSSASTASSASASAVTGTVATEFRGDSASSYYSTPAERPTSSLPHPPKPAAIAEFERLHAEREAKIDEIAKDAAQALASQERQRDEEGKQRYVREELYGHLASAPSPPDLYPRSDQQGGAARGGYGGSDPDLPRNAEEDAQKDMYPPGQRAGREQDMRSLREGGAYGIPHSNGDGPQGRGYGRKVDDSPLGPEHEKRLPYSKRPANPLNPSEQSHPSGHE
jgi:hypothetical protein